MLIPNGLNKIVNFIYCGTLKKGYLIAVSLSQKTIWQWRFQDGLAHSNNASSFALPSDMDITKHYNYFLTSDTTIYCLASEEVPIKIKQSNNGCWRSSRIGYNILNASNSTFAYLKLGGKNYQF